jgi:hypothetical protein
MRMMLDREAEGAGAARTARRNALQGAVADGVEAECHRALLSRW